MEVYGWGPSDEWTRENVQNRGSLGSHYPNRIWATEGDSPSFFYVYANGLNVPEHVDYGGWGGRLTLKNREIYEECHLSKRAERMKNSMMITT